MGFADLPEIVRARNRPVQSLRNLKMNAAKFTPVSASCRTAGRVQVEVADAGTGLSADRLASVFEPFVQAASSSTRQFGGLGLVLGLSIVRQLVDLHGGTVEASSEGQGKGSIFPHLSSRCVRRCGRARCAGCNAGLSPTAAVAMSRPLTATALCT